MSREEEEAGGVQEDLLGYVEVVERDELRELVDRVHVRELARELGAARTTHTHEQSQQT